jgi:tetratricopeptide (TPR) repeat protein
MIAELLLCLASAAADAGSLIKQGDAADRALKTREALVFYQRAEKLAPDDPELMIKLAKQHGELMTELKGAAVKQSAETALSYAQKALRLAPKMADAELAVAICYGRLLELVPSRTKVEYSRLVFEHATRASKLDPRSDYAWHMLGRWHQAVATMDGITKGIVRIVYGGLPAASLEDARECFERAIQLQPDRLAHHIELGRTLAMMDRSEEAKRSIEKGLAMPNKERDDPGTKARGKKTLDDLRG